MNLMAKYESTSEEIIAKVNHTERAYPRDRVIHDLFSGQARRTPEAVAVEYEDRQLTYRELDERSNRLAHHLLKRGVGPDVLVGICVERSLEMVTGLLGTLKAGGAYVPLEPSYSAERLQFMLEDTAAPVLLTQNRLKAQLPKSNAKVICLDTDWDQIAHEPSSAPEVELTSANLAYAIYTSGSTGRPKGVLIPHQGVTRLVFGQEYTHFGPDRVFAQLAPVSFDASTLELWGPLLHGGRCVLFGRRVPEPEELGQFLKRKKVTSLWLTSALYNAVIDQDPQVLESVEELLIGGEALSVNHVNKGLSSLPGTQIINGYGPTESTTFTCCYRIPRKVDPQKLSIPIGRPIANTQVYILDEQKQPVPVGVAGELYIGGDGLARGYLNRPELTAEKFIANPFGEGRLYRSGDRVRYLEDGNIEFLGRLDNQVKIRGFRIELGEIEYTLASHPLVKQAVVLAREDRPGDIRLVAYVVSEQKDNITDQLRRHIREKLPDYMVPSAIILLDQLPLTPNGKVDRKSLPKPEGRTDQKQYVAPQTEQEKLVVTIWEELLGVKPIGIEDNFFELGGHSLLAVRVISRLRSELGLELRLNDIFKQATIAGLLKDKKQATPLDGGPTPVLRPSRRSNESLPLSTAQHQMWFLNSIESIPAVYYLPFAVKLQGDLDVPTLKQAFSTIVQRHEVLRTIYVEENGKPFQRILDIAAIDLPVDDLSGINPEKQQEQYQRIQKEEIHRPFRLSEDRPIRCRLVRFHGQHHVLLLTIHHIAADGWSMTVLNRELGVHYGAGLHHQSVELPELPIQYSDYAQWESEYLNGEVLNNLESYWSGQLKDANFEMDLPRKSVARSGDARPAKRIPLRLKPDLVHRLRKWTAELQGTLYMALMVALGLVLNRYGHREESVIGSVVAGRDIRETENLIGFFVNTLPIRV